MHCDKRAVVAVIDPCRSTLSMFVHLRNSDLPCGAMALLAQVFFLYIKYGIECLRL